MWWIWALIFGLVLTWGFEIRIRDISSRTVNLEDDIKRIKDEIAKLQRSFKVE